MSKCQRDTSDSPRSRIASPRSWPSNEDRSYLGSLTDIDFSDRNDNSTLANLSLSYTPTNKTLVELQYQGENRKSDFIVAPYKFNSLNLSFRYNF